MRFKWEINQEVLDICRSRNAVECGFRVMKETIKIRSMERDLQREPFGFCRRTQILGDIKSSRLTVAFILLHCANIFWSTIARLLLSCQVHNAKVSNPASLQASFRSLMVILFRQ